MTLDIFEAFRNGAVVLAKDQARYSDLHKAHGIDQAEWELLTNKEYWTVDQAREIRSILANVIEVAMTIAGMPAIPLPGQYVAAVIAEVVSPCNRMIAVMKSPDTFDAADASGLLGTTEIKDMTKQQLMALVVYYSAGGRNQPEANKVPREVGEEVASLNVREPKKARA